MADFIINDKFKTTTDYSGPTPAWMAPSKPLADPIEARHESNFMGMEAASRQDLKMAYDFVHKVKPANKKKNFYSLAGFVGYRNRDILKEIEYGKVFKIKIKDFVIDFSDGYEKRKNEFILKQCNEFAKNSIKDDLILTDSWILTSILETPQFSCLWDKAVANPIKYIILANQDEEEAFKREFIHFEKMFNRIKKVQDKEKRNRLFDGLAKSSIGPKAIKKINYEYKFLSTLSEDFLFINTEGLAIKEIAAKIKEVINHDQACKAKGGGSSKAKKSKAKRRKDRGTAKEI